MSPLLILTKESFLGLKNSVPNSFEERESEREERRLLEERKGEEGFDFCVHRKTFHKPIWLTGKFYLLSPLSQMGSRKPPKPRRMDIVEQQNMAVFGAASPPHS